MQKILRSVLLLCVIIGLTTKDAKSQSTLIHYWHFNNYAQGNQYTDTIHGVPADFSVLDTAKAKIVYAEIPGTPATYSTHLDTVTTLATDYDTINLRMSDTAGAALRVRNPSDSMQLYFYIPTTGYKNIVVNYASQSSSVSHGQLHQVFDYSVDSGTTWRTSGLSMPSDSAWLVYHRTTLTFTTDTDVNNNAKLILRITFNGNTTSTSGNNRFDNVSVDGDVIPPTSIGNTTNNQHSQLLICPNPTSQTISTIGDLKEYQPNFITDLTGKHIVEFTYETTINNFDISNLSKGVYFISFTNKNDGAILTTPFVKN